MCARTLRRGGSRWTLISTFLEIIAKVVTTDFFTHPGWSQFNLHNDLALVHLPFAVNFTGGDVHNST